MQIPLSYADAVIGASGTNISYIRRASGASITIQETRGVPGEMTVEMSGTSSQIQAAQQLVQVFVHILYSACYLHHCWLSVKTLWGTPRFCGRWCTRWHGLLIRI